MDTFAANTPLNSAGNDMGAQTAISPSGQYAAVDYNAPGGWGSPYFKVVDINSCGNVSGAFSAQTTSCQSRDYLPQLQQAIPGLVKITNPTFATENSLDFIAETNVDGALHYARYSLTAAGSTFRLEDYLAMGDSYASGEGTFAYIDGTDTDLNKCHQSLDAYSFLMEPSLGSTQSVACAGAVMGNIKRFSDHKMNQLLGVKDSDISKADADQAIASHTPGFVDQDLFVLQDNPQAVTISIGGNDIGFSSIIKRCILPFNDGSSLDQDCYATYEDRLELVNTINEQFNKLVGTYTHLRANDPTRRIYVIGYPQIVQPDGDCGLNVHLSQSETEFASQLISYLDYVIQQASAKAGVFYVDTQQALDGHELCQSGEDKAVNGLTAGNDKFHVFGNESYHPNRLGHQLLANDILAKTKNLTLPMPAAQNITPPIPNGSLPILQVPKTGRALNEIYDGSQDMLFTIDNGQLILNQETAPGIAAGSTFSAVLHSTPTSLGTIKAGQDDTISGKLQLPTGLPAGIHTLDLYGKNITGEAIDLQKLVYIENSPDDYDGDGIPNAQDSCLFIPNSGVDQDRDGVDDTCDGSIGLPPTDSESTTALAKAPADTTTNRTVLATSGTDLQPANSLSSLGSQPATSVKVNQSTVKPKVLGAKTTLHKTLPWYVTLAGMIAVSSILWLAITKLLVR
jgi:lysophospholipase L1-like esterase